MATSEDFDRELGDMRTRITKMKTILEEGHSHSNFSSDEYMTNYFTTVHIMCQRTRDHSPQSYEKYKKIFYDYIESSVGNLSKIYRVFHKNPTTLVHVINIFMQHVRSEGMFVIHQAEDAANNKVEKASGAWEQALVTEAIELHDKYFAYVTNKFANNALFHKALEQAFETFCNKVVSGTSNAEHLASLCDYILKKWGSPELSDEAIEEILDKVVHFLSYISDKDLFAEFYRRKLSCRLLFGKNANLEHESVILTKLKQQSSGQFTSGMEAMVTDMRLTKDIQNQFQEYLVNNQAACPGMKLTVTVLTPHLWPSYKSSKLYLPAEMLKCFEVFKEFYETKMKQTELEWIYSLGTCKIEVKFEQKTIELIVGTYQAAILLLFNAADKLSYSDIKTRLNLDDDDLVRLLQSLSCAKYKILNKEPTTGSVSSEDYFELNSKFTDRMSRIRIPPPLPPADEREKMVKDVVKDRRYAIDASIVRILESHKVLHYPEIVTECVQQLSRTHFKPGRKEIEKRIEYLTTHRLLERDEDNSEFYQHRLRTLNGP